MGVFLQQKRSKKLEKNGGFGGNARVLHLSIDLLCIFGRNMQVYEI